MSATKITKIVARISVDYSNWVDSIPEMNVRFECIQKGFDIYKRLAFSDPLHVCGTDGNNNLIHS